MRANCRTWEVGSEFNLELAMAQSGPCLPIGADLYGSGRDALRSLLEYGVKELGWTKLWVPSYFCQTVLKDIRVLGMQMVAYEDSPVDDVRTPIAFDENAYGAILTLNYFGLRSTNRPIEGDRKRLAVIEDHTHDPWSSLVTNSTADYCVCSLRKTTPVPDGGLLWSPLGHQLPECPIPSTIRCDASMKKLTGMALKSLYLSGAVADRSLYRHLLESGEHEIASGPISSMPFLTRAILSGFDAKSWRRKRLENFITLWQRLKHSTRFDVFVPESNFAVPFCAILVLPTNEVRDALRLSLIESKVFPAILWSLEIPEVEGVRDSDVQLSRRSLMIHCDGRYSECDMILVGDMILKHSESWILDGESVKPR